MKTNYLEHANITVSNLKEGISFFKAAFPGFKIRGGGNGMNSDWVHFGNESTYLAINQGETKTTNNHPDYGHNGINHIGFVVEDVESLAQRLLAAGFKRNYPKQVQEYRIRDYFADGDGNQYEFVEYLTDDWNKRNDYSD